MKAKPTAMKAKPKQKFDLSIWSDERIARAMKSAAKSAKKMTKRELESYFVSSIGNTHSDINARNRALRKVKRLEKRIEKALSAIPFGDDTDDSGEALHWYSRVSERTVREVEQALGRRR
jgi:hypothetical protein